MYSGYCCVIGFLKICFSVMPKPLTESKRLRAHENATTSAAVTSALSVATGSSTFQPKAISWS